MSDNIDEQDDDEDLIACPECLSADITPGAKRCPHCGSQMNVSIARYVVIGLSAILLAGLVAWWVVAILLGVDL